MQKPIQQIYSTDEDIQCEKCKQARGTFISLTCDHKFCVICLSFMYVKHRKVDPNQGTVKCIKCEDITLMHPSHVQLITKTLKQQVLPNIESDNNQLTVSKNAYALNNATISRKIKSQEQSFQQNITPSTTKCFYSKCQSPSSRKKNMFSKYQCQTHKGQAITHLCFSCQIQPLCIKCLSSSKKHLDHQLKDLQKSIVSETEKASDIKIEISQNISHLQLYKKRVKDRGQIIKDRAHQILENIKTSFQNLFEKLEQKCDKIIKICENNFKETLDKNNLKLQQIQQSIRMNKDYYEKIISVQKQTENLDFIFKLNRIKNKYNGFKHGISYVQLEQKAQLPSNTIFKQIDRICCQINKLNISFKSSSLSRMGNIQLQNCRSQSKIRKQHNKRLKTNFVSLNSSRQKKIKKSAKTQQDERKLKTQKAQKINAEKNNKNNNLPAYISDYINKKSNKYGTDASLCALQLTSPNIQNSKLTSKLSKTISPQQLQRKKKDNMALIKERMERKTTQPSCKNKRQSSKKKKMN